MLVATKATSYPVPNGPDTCNRALIRAGQLFEISDGNRRAVVTEQGGTLARVNWDGLELLESANEDGYAGAAAYGQILVPWTGRIAGGTYEYEGERHVLPLNDHFRSSAIHGWARWMAWQPREHSAGRVTLGCRHLATPGYPFPLDLEQSYEWRSDCLEICLVATNIGPSTAPFGYGVHPYLTVGSPQVDNDVLHIRASGYLEVGGDLIPNGQTAPVEGTPWDFREPRPVGTDRLDVTLTDLARDDQGRVVVVFSSPTGGVSITCRYDDPIQYVQLFTGDTLPERQRRGLAIEPYTCAPDAFNNGLGLAHLAPGGSLRARWTLSA